MKKTYELVKDKETKGTYRFMCGDAFGPGRGMSIYVPKSHITPDIEKIAVTIEWPYSATVNSKILASVVSEQ